MIISVEELKKHITTDMSDSVLEAMLQALELTIRKYTNNRFHQVPAQKVRANVIGGVVQPNNPLPFKAGDTVQITYGERAIDCGLYTVKEVRSDHTFTVNEEITDMAFVDVYKVKYGIDVVLGAVNLMKWDLENRDKIGIQSETISRHSVTYFNMDANNSMLGYPKALLGFLKPYMKARF